MSVPQRLTRLERLEDERELLVAAEELAAEYGLPVEEVLRRLDETGRRIERYGLDAALRLMAREYGVPEDDVRAQYDKLVEEYKRC